jgi:hypothetical protein
MKFLVGTGKRDARFAVVWVMNVGLRAVRKDEVPQL